MNKMTRAIAMTGVAVAAGVTVAAGPAAASPGTTAAPAVYSAAVASAKPAAPPKQSFQRRDRIFGFYNSPRTCHKIGRIGQWKNQWQRYSCFKVYRGFHSGDWALKVYYGWNYNHGNKHWNSGKGNHGGGSYGGGSYGGGDYGRDNYGDYGQRKG
ncbi:hypothetical protein [Actinoplanes subglobosus]|uniref:Uncharacterized protein n=1 Tax=Actinoplanes subglobosus TaxID=1547892 RepID=A0ABV8JAD8_9ACTN